MAQPIRGGGGFGQWEPEWHPGWGEQLSPLAALWRRDRSMGWELRERLAWQEVMGPGPGLCLGPEGQSRVTSR